MIWQAFKFFFGYFCTEGITREKEWILKMKTMIALQKGSLEDKVEDYLRIQKKKNHRDKSMRQGQKYRKHRENESSIGQKYRTGNNINKNFQREKYTSSQMEKTKDLLGT